MWVVLKVLTRIEVMGVDSTIEGAAPGLVGFMPIFSTRDEAIEFDGGEDHIAEIELKNE